VQPMPHACRLFTAVPRARCTFTHNEEPTLDKLLVKPAGPAFDGEGSRCANDAPCLPTVNRCTESALLA